jgi:gliding motility-associated-like protein
MKLLFSVLTLLLCFSSFIPSLVNAQSTMFSENFEGLNSWQLSGPSTPNSWIVSTCAGNGIAQPGTSSAYISSGGAIAGCGPTGSEHYGYVNASSGSQAVVLYKTVHNTCFSSLEVTADLMIDGTVGQDFLEVVYSTNNGASWIPVSGQLTGISAWQTLNYVLPGALNNTSFWLGFRFTYDNATITGFPAAVDNVLLEGITADVTNPTAVCPANFTIYANSSCVAMVPDLPPSVTKSDNCTAVGDLIVTQMPAIGSSLSANAVATITVTDQAGNFTTCNTNFVFVDTIKPLIVCPANQTVSANASCLYTLPNLAPSASATDNCTASGSLTFAQTPVVGMDLAVGVYTIQLSAQDASTNTGVCSFSLTVEDVTPPVVTCPTYFTIPADASCTATVGDLTSAVTVVDNCTTASVLFSYSQVPSAIQSFSDTIPATVYVTDAAGNIGSCAFNLVASNTVAPVVVCLSDTTVFTTNPCNYFIPNLAAAHDITAGCVATSELTISQSPASASTSSGLTLVTTTITDPFGNSTVCVTTVHPVDVILPTITCPANQTVNNGSNCYYLLPDYTSLAIITDNCPDYTLVQSPAPTLNISSGTNMITLTVTDAGGNQATCSFQVTVFESVAPSIVCPGNIQSCDVVVTYLQPDATDNCLYEIIQTDNSGLTSGDVFPEGITTQSYAVIDSSGNTATCSFTVEVLEIPDQAMIALDTIVYCNQFSGTVSADAVTNGTGSWSVIQGTGTFANALSNTTTVNGLAIGTNKLVWSVSSPSCGTTYDTLVVIVWPLPSVAAVQDTLLACSPVGLFVNGNVPQFGIGTWSNNSGIIFEDVNAPVTAVSNLNGGNHILVWTISSGTCPSNSDTMILVSPNMANANFPDTTLCIADFPITFNGSAPTAEQTPIWSTMTGETVFSTNYASQTNLLSASVGTVSILYWLDHPICGATRDTVTLIIADCDDLITNIPTMFTPNHDGKNDVFQIPNLGVNYPGCKVTIFNRWGGLIFESEGYQLPWDGTFKGDDVQMGTYFYHIELNDEEKKEVEGSISVIR